MAAISERNRKWWVVVAMALATILITIDFGGVMIILPAIGRELDTSTTGLQWTANAYLLAFAVVMVAAGRLADIFGRRLLLLIGIAIFIVASSLCGLAQADWWIIAARAVQGTGAGVFLTASLSIVSGAFPLEEQSKGIGVWAGVIGIGIAVGPFVGGFLTEVASWRWFFFVNIPVALLAVFLTLIVVRESRDETAGRHVDLFGLTTVTAGLTALVFGIQQSETLGWGSVIVVGTLAAGVILLALFVFVEPRLHEPLIDLRLFANRGYLGANAVAFAQNFGLGAVMFFLTLYLQYVLDYSPLEAGLVFLPLTALFTIGNLQASRVAGAIGPRLSMAGGMTLVAASFLLLALVTPTSGLTIVLAALVIAGIGQSLAYTISTTAGMGAIPPAKAGAASGVLQMVRQLGVVFGVAVPGALFKALENKKLAELLTAAGARLDASDRSEIRGLLSGSEAAERKVTELAPAVADQVERVVREAFVYAFDGAMVLFALVSVAGVMASFLVVGGAPQEKHAG
jgi:EmrB/QacA subfamily drug resistance transporter